MEARKFEFRPSTDYNHTLPGCDQGSWANKDRRLLFWHIGNYSINVFDVVLLGNYFSMTHSDDMINHTAVLTVENAAFANQGIYSASYMGDSPLQGAWMRLIVRGMLESGIHTHRNRNCFLYMHLRGNVTKYKRICYKWLTAHSTCVTKTYVNLHLTNSKDVLITKAVFGKRLNYTEIAMTADKMEDTADIFGLNS